MPIAHLLTPMIARKAQEIPDAIGPPRPLNSGYLQARNTPPIADAFRADPNLIPNTTGRGTLAPVTDVPDERPKAKAKKLPKGVIAIPAGGDEPIGMAEDGRSVYMSEPAPAPVKSRKVGKKTILSGPLTGVNEQGAAVDMRGRPLGYMAQQNVPQVQTLERRPSHVPTQDEALVTPDSFGAQVLKQRFGGHLKAQQDNVDPRRPNAFPLGYFNSMQPYEQQEIEEGTARLRELTQGHSI
jgi:hypothetical protein